MHAHACMSLGRKRKSPPRHPERDQMCCPLWVFVRVERAMQGTQCQKHESHTAEGIVL